ncbi:hypothetical protein [Pedobacter ghigonis]|uniref:hypothetical protein n=1 Tax=Pedobacter ghigonis TaxID=2730403 RepID=UPI00158E4F39|nr:hypothetical protein [Pedobacter ghigonis]
MVTSIKVKDNSNIGFIIIPFCLFPIAFLAIAGAFNLSYLITFAIMFCLYTLYMVFILRVLQKNEEIYAIVANEAEVTFLDRGTFKWEEINTIKSIDNNTIFLQRHPHYFITVSLKNGKKFDIDVTNFDYQFEELTSILNSLGKLDSGL